jgi:hypothetical protein
MKINRFNALMLLCVMMLGGCRKDSKNTDTLIFVDKEFNVFLREQLDEQGGKLQLGLSSIENLTCGGTRINYANDVKDAQLTLTLKGFLYPTTCNSVPEPAKDTVTFGQLKAGNYTININLGSTVVNKGTLAVSENSYSILMQKENGIRFMVRELMRIPAGTIWGYVGYDESQAAQHAEFAASLDRMVRPIDLPQGNYGYFSIGTNLDINDAYFSSKSTVRRVLFKLTGTNKALQDLVQRHRAAGLDLKIYTSDGKVF